MIHGEAVAVTIEGELRAAITHEAKYGVFKELLGEGEDREALTYHTVTLAPYFGELGEGDRAVIAFKSYSGNKMTLHGEVQRVTKRSIRLKVTGSVTGKKSYIDTINKAEEYYGNR